MRHRRRSRPPPLHTPPPLIPGEEAARRQPREERLAWVLAARLTCPSSSCGWCMEKGRVPRLRAWGQQKCPGARQRQGVYDKSGWPILRMGVKTE